MGMTDYVTIERYRQEVALRKQYQARDRILSAEIAKLRARIKALENELHNERCEESDYIWCNCGREHDPIEVARACSLCGGMVEGVALMVHPDNPDEAPRMRGEAAQKRGDGVWSNPYATGTKDFDDWLLGWWMAAYTILDFDWENVFNVNNIGET